MRKYASVAALLFKAQLAYRLSIAFGMLFTVVKIVFAYIVWGAIFAERQVVSGFTLGTMLTYYVLSSFLSQLDMSEGVSGEVANRIRDGSFSKYLVLPVWIEGHFLAQTFGAAGLTMLFNLLAAALWVVLFRIPFAITIASALLPGTLLLILMGLIFMVQLNFFIGILAFKFQDVWIFLMIKNNFLSFLTGALMPLTLLPEGLLGFLKVFPFYNVTYLPSMLLIGRNADELLPGLCTLALWMVAFFFINRVAFDHLRKRYEGVGI